MTYNLLRGYSQFTKTFILFLLLIFSPYTLYSQKLLTDTLYVEFKADTFLVTSQFCISDIQDTRNEDPDFVMYQTRKKFLLFPVDQEIHTTKPLADALAEGFKTNDDCLYSYALKINRFEIEKRKGRFSSPTYLMADIPVFEIKNDTQHFFGTLYYDHLYIPLKRKESLKESTENLLNYWHATFKTDLIILNAISKGASTDILSNFLTDPSVRPLYLNLQAGVFAGPDWCGFQGEMFFTRPEIHSTNKIISGIVRYQNNKDYESLAIGRNSEHFTFRPDKNLVFDIDLNILVGFLRWKEVEVHKPTLYQIVNAEISSIQSIMINRQNKKGFTARFGAIETLGYIYDKKLRFQLGAFLGMGYKF